MKLSEKVDKIYEVISNTYVTFDQTDDPWMTNNLSSTPFRSLVSATLSTVTTTSRVVKACVPLYKKVSTFEQLLAMDDEELREIIKPVAHYNRKTKNLKMMCEQIISIHGGKIPDNREDLMKLQGVGRKVTELMMNFVFSVPSIAVDTHILRVLNRTGIIKTNSAEEATDLINMLTPPQYKRHAHEWLIQHGMKVCVARNPHCEVCPITEYCSFYKNKV